MSLSPPADVNFKDLEIVVVKQKEVEGDEKDGISICATASSSGSPTILPAPPSPGPFGNFAQLSAKTPQQGWRKRRIPRWKSPLLMVVFFIIGLAMSLAHCIFYPKLSGRLVGNSSSQEQNIR